jgi:hypothetical protein
MRKHATAVHALPVWAPVVATFIDGSADGIQNADGIGWLGRAEFRRQAIPCG